MKLTQDQRIRSLVEHLKGEYRDDKIDTPIYREYLLLLRGVSEDRLTQAKIYYMLIELPEEVRP